MVSVPLGDSEDHRMARAALRGGTAARCKSREASGATTGVRFKPLSLPQWAPASVSADLHVHMNYGGHYRSTLQTLAAQARAEDLDVIYNTIVNKEQRIPDIAYAGGAVTRDGGVTIFQAQEFHTSYWGHLGLLDLRDHFLTPDFSAYQQSALTSPYPHNGAVADLAHAQRRARRLRASVRLGDRAGKGEVADERVAGRRRARQGGLHRSGRLLGSQGDPLKSGIDC